MDDLISRQAAIDALENDKAALDKIIKGMSAEDMLLKYYVAQHNQVSYDIDAIVQLPPIQPEIIRCKDCKHFEYDHPYIIQGISVLGHEVCNAWGDGCKTDENGYCFMAERRTDEQTD